jgi:hypothetical protein
MRELGGHGGNRATIAIAGLMPVTFLCGASSETALARSKGALKQGGRRAT